MTPSRILGATTLEWTLFDLALALVGAVSGADLREQLAARRARTSSGTAEASACSCEDDEQLREAGRGRGELPGSSTCSTYADLDGLAARGRAFAAANPAALAEAREAIDEDDLFTYIYTSGTTGPPKGCMIRHRNYYAMVGDRRRASATSSAEATSLLLYLPLAHNFGRLMQLSARTPATRSPSAPIRSRSPTPCRGAADGLPERPRVYEKMHAAVLAKFDEATA